MNALRRHLARAVLLAAAAVVLLPASRVAAQQIFLHAGKDFPGTSLDPDHKDWSDVLSVGQVIRRVPRPGGAGTRALPGALELVRRTDSVSPLLLKAATAGTVLPVVALEFVRGNPDHPGRTRFHRIALSNVVVVEVRSEIVTRGRTETTEETVRLGYTAGAWTYTEVDASGEPLRDRTLAWDFLREAGGSWSERLQEFRVSGNFQPGGRVGVRWQAETGRRYQILRPLDWNDPRRLQLVAEIPAGDAGERTFEVPAVQDMDLFLVREVE